MVKFVIEIRSERIIENKRENNITDCKVGRYKIFENRRFNCESVSLYTAYPW